ncbi:hypothetical protein [Pseudomonas sp. LFM046]|uniref:hypothetical protein n=1 Tax=Pseudomonas sp. LFM046 TaxID=1608357 RepID=UPI000698D287|nr:hypothetical protein [Pseudomonas sp. LFM046]
MNDSRPLYDPELSVNELKIHEAGVEAVFRSSVPPKADQQDSSWIEYIAGQWVVVKPRPGAARERRYFHATRKHIDKLLDQGWSITGRDPVRLEIHQRVKIVRGGKLVNG